MTNILTKQWGKRSEDYEIMKFATFEEAVEFASAHGKSVKPMGVDNGDVVVRIKL